MKRKDYKSPQLEWIFVYQDIITASGDNFVEDPWTNGSWDY